MAVITTFTLNQLKIMLTTWFNNHAQINTVVYSNDFDFNADRQINYPVVHIEHLSTNLADVLTNHNYQITIGDITQPNNSEMEDLIVSDAVQIAEDFFTYLENTEGIYFTPTSSLQPFTDDTGDRTCGITMTITIGVARRSNICDTPTKN